jgi:DnaJ-class molecular chaperone
VSTTASQEEIKQSYYSLAKKYHPDAVEEEEKEASKVWTLI